MSQSDDHGESNLPALSDNFGEPTFVGKSRKMPGADRAALRDALPLARTVCLIEALKAWLLPAGRPVSPPFQGARLVRCVRRKRNVLIFRRRSLSMIRPWKVPFAPKEAETGHERRVQDDGAPRSWTLYASNIVRQIS
jgi:hypothetical protein